MFSSKAKYLQSSQTLRKKAQKRADARGSVGLGRSSSVRSLTRLTRSQTGSDSGQPLDNRKVRLLTRAVLCWSFHTLPDRRGSVGFATPANASAAVKHSAFVSTKQFLFQRAVQPPSINSVCPVIKDAAEEHRNTTAPATSTGSPTRCRAAIRSTTST